MRVQTLGTTLQDAPPPHIILAIHEGGHFTEFSPTFSLIQCLSRSPGLRIVIGAGCVASVKRRVFSFKKAGLSTDRQPTTPRPPLPHSYSLTAILAVTPRSYWLDFSMRRGLSRLLDFPPGTLCSLRLFPCLALLSLVLCVITSYRGTGVVPVTNGTHQA